MTRNFPDKLRISTAQAALLLLAWAGQAAFCATGDGAEAVPVPGPALSTVEKPVEASVEQTPEKPDSPPVAPQVVKSDKSDKAMAAESAVRTSCDALFPSRLQADVRASCAAGGVTYARSAHKSAQIQCRLSYGLSARSTMACLIGVSIAEDVAAKKTDDLDRKRSECAGEYPAHTEVDLYLQESCLTGIYIPRTLNRAGPGACREISLERSFIGPCETGLSLATRPLLLTPAPAAPTAPGAIPQLVVAEAKAADPKPAAKPEVILEANSHNQLCERYFDHRRLHQGYRACLNARGLALRSDAGLPDALGACSGIVSDAQSELEKAACVVGVSMYRNLASGKPTNPRFGKCGVEKVSYQERDVLACLAAASFLDFGGDKREAGRACKTVFSAKKSVSRNDCERAVESF